jgi:hypothetical protein
VHKSGNTREAWEAEQERIAVRYSNAVELVARIENRETVANSELDVTEEERVERNKESADERKQVLEELMNARVSV